MTDKQRIVFKGDIPYSQIPNELIGSKVLSAKAKALYCYLASKPPGWTFYNTDILKHMKEGRDAVKIGFAELEKEGWIERNQFKDEAGKFGGINISISTGIKFNEGRVQSVRKPLTENPSSAKPLYNNTNLSNTDINKKIITKKNSKRSELLTLTEWESKNGILDKEKIEAWATERNLSLPKLERALDKFRYRTQSQGKKYADWKSAFQNWIRSGWLGNYEDYELERKAQDKPLPRAYVPAIGPSFNPTNI